MAIYEVKVDNTKEWTVSDYLELQENPNQQLINGQLIMSPSPSVMHQRVLRNLALKLNEYAEKRSDEVLFSAIDVYLNETNVPQPDIVYIFKENKNSIKEKGIEGAPDLIVEIISPSNSYIDRYQKKDLYEKSGVKEYWLVDPNNATLEIYHLGAEKYEMVQYVVSQGQIKSQLLTQLKFDLQELWP
ncbi:MAG: Uma2 family endonuclease [Cyclobacteriaceae bacterium]